MTVARFLCYPNVAMAIFKDFLQTSYIGAYSVALNTGEKIINWTIGAPELICPKLIVVSLSSIPSTQQRSVPYRFYGGSL